MHAVAQEGTQSAPQQSRHGAPQESRQAAPEGSAPRVPHAGPLQGPHPAPRTDGLQPTAAGSPRGEAEQGTASRRVGVAGRWVRNCSAAKQSVLEACAEVDRDAHNQSHYVGEYSAKKFELVSDLLPEFVLGMQNLEDERLERERLRKLAERASEQQGKCHANWACWSKRYFESNEENPWGSRSGRSIHHL